MDAPIQAEAAPNPRIRALEVAEEIAKMRALLKPIYLRLDALTDELHSLVGLNAEVPVKEGYDMLNGLLIVVPEQTLQIVDNFAHRDVVFKTAAVRRFEISSENAEQRKQRMAKNAP